MTAVSRANTTLTLYFLLTLWWTHVGLLFINIRFKQTLVTHSFLYHYTEEPQHSRDSRLGASQSRIWKLVPNNKLKKNPFVINFIFPDPETSCQFHQELLVSCKKITHTTGK